jgi:hypothetical protein
MTRQSMQKYKLHAMHWASAIASRGCTQQPDALYTTLACMQRCTTTRSQAQRTKQVSKPAPVNKPALTSQAHATLPMQLYRNADRMPPNQRLAIQATAQPCATSCLNHCRLALSCSKHRCWPAQHCTGRDRDMYTSQTAWATQNPQLA